MVRRRTSSRDLETRHRPRLPLPNTIARLSRILRSSGGAAAEEVRYRPADRITPLSRRGERTGGGARQREMRQPAIGRVDVEPDRPEFVVMRLAHLHFRHPEKDFARIEIAKNPPFELQEKRRVEGVAQVEQRIRTRQTLAQFASRHSDATHPFEVVHIIRRCLIKQAITSLEAMLTQAPLEIANARFIFARVGGRWQELEPDSVETEPAQAQHPLQRHRKIAASLRVFRRKPAAEKDRHRQRIVRLGFCSSRCCPSFDGPCIIR